MMRRRELLQAIAAAGGSLAMPGLGGLSFAATARPMLVLVYLRGGCDGLNLVSPANDPEFVAARASELRVADGGQDAGHSLANSLVPGLDFRLHPQAGGLAELYQAGQLAVIHAAGVPEAQRSHFVAIDMMARGVPDTKALARIDSGWLTRLLRAVTPRDTVAVVSAGTAVPGDLLAWPAAVPVADLGGGFGAPGGPPVEAALHALYRDTPGDVGEAGRRALGAMHAIDARLPRDAQNKAVGYQPAPGVAYEPAGDYMRPLRVVAQLVKLELGLQTAVIELGGWDTHEYQPGRFRNLVERLSAGLSAFYNDLAAYHDRLTMVVLSEFGRRLRSNKSNGTDHGRGGVMMVLGGRVAGGRMYGRWPGLASPRLEEGVDLAVTTDYRRVLREVAANGGAAPADLFPGLSDSAPLGLFRSA